MIYFLGYVFLWNVWLRVRINGTLLFSWKVQVSSWIIIIYTISINLTMMPLQLSEMECGTGDFRSSAGGSRVKLTYWKIRDSSSRITVSLSASICGRSRTMLPWAATAPSPQLNGFKMFAWGSCRRYTSAHCDHSVSKSLQQRIGCKDLYVAEQEVHK